MARLFKDVVNKIKEVAPQELVKRLDNRINYWAPESAWYNLSNFINQNVIPSSTDKTSVAIYAALCDCTEDEMLERFATDGI